MIRKLLCITTIVMIVALACVPASAFYVNTLQSRIGGALFSNSGLATSSGTSVPGPLAGWTGGTLTPAVGSYYAGDTTPVKWGDWAWTPTTTGYYDAYATWSNVTAAQNMNPIFTVNNAGTVVNVAKNQTTGGGAWNLLATGLQYNASTQYKTRLSTIGTGASGKRASFDAVAWAASAAGAAIYGGPANGATGTVDDFMELSWTAGASTSFFDVYFGTTSGELDLLVGDLTPDMLACDLVGSLVADETYFWRVDAKNVDRVTAGEEWSFTTLPVGNIPEPGSMLALGSGLIGLFGIMRRKRA